MKKSITLITLLFLISFVNCYSQTYKVIVNSSNEISSLSKKEASDLFLKKKVKWANGNKVTPVDLSSNSKVRETFSQQVHGRSTAAIRNFWQQAAFSGTGTAPSEKISDEDVIEFVKNNPGAVGYVSLSANTTGVKIITIN
jgi:ABC-type phosphate transport system substrate-binding protein